MTDNRDSSNSRLDEKDMVKLRIQELISELEQCREDERNGWSQILSVLTAAGTILGFLAGAAFLGRSRNEVLYSGEVKAQWIKHLLGLLTNTRVIFWLTCCIFNATFLYCVVLGIRNVLRYYHIQEVQDRLHELISRTPDDEERGKLLKFHEFAAPIITMNFGHITTSHAALHFGSYALSAFFAVLFSIGIVLSQFVMIQDSNSTDNFFRAVDYIVLICTLLLMVGAMFLFLRLSRRAKTVAKNAMETGQENLKIREALKRNPEGVREKLYAKSALFRHRLKYLLFPKISDWYKQGLLLIGYVWFLVFSGRLHPGMSFRETGTVLSERLVPLILTLVVFEYLAYQARYQVNDIRGIDEDTELGKTNKLIPGTMRLDKEEDKYEIGYSIQLSLKVIVLRCIAAIILAFILRKAYGVNLPEFLGILLLVTLLYEAARGTSADSCSVEGNSSAFWIFVTVGLGYPLRFFVGANAAGFNPSSVFDVDFCLVILLMCYGIFASILSWTAEVVRRMVKAYEDSGKLPDAYKKPHYLYLQNVIQDRYLRLVEKNASGAKQVLRERGKWNDPWNTALFFAAAAASWGEWLYVQPGPALWICLGANLVLILSSWTGGKVFQTLNILSVLMYAAVFVCGEYRNSITQQGVIFIVLGTMVSATYYLLRYQPELKPIDFKGLMYSAAKAILGEKACNYLKRLDEKER